MEKQFTIAVGEPVPRGLSQVWTRSYSAQTRTNHAGAQNTFSRCSRVVLARRAGKI